MPEIESKGKGKRKGDGRKKLRRKQIGKKCLRVALSWQPKTHQIIGEASLSVRIVVLSLKTFSIDEGVTTL